MTTPPADGLLFDVAALPTPVERLLLLADQYVQHTDTLDRLLRDTPPSEPDAHAASEQRLASATRTAIQTVADERLSARHELSDAMVRLQQLAFLSGASTDRPLPIARMLTSLAPETVMVCADSVAFEIRRRWSTTDAPDHQLTTTQYTALWEIACGHVVATSSLGRHYVHYRDERVLIATLRSLKTHGLAERAPKTAPSAYVGGPLQDRVRLTRTGTTALAAAMSRPTATRPPGTAPAPTLAPAATQAATRSR
jgi:hypothetical protein